MKSKSFSVLLLLTLLVSFVVAPTAAGTQGVAPGPVSIQQNVCTITSEGAQVFPGGVFHYRNESQRYGCWYVLGQDAQPAGVAWIPVEERNNTFLVSNTTGGGVCSRPENLRYSKGAVVRFGGSTYRCSNIFGPDLRPAGVAWVEVEVKDDDSFVVKGLPVNR
jgi:hypothetical protein